jgi:hypothetical protein
VTLAVAVMAVVAVVATAAFSGSSSSGMARMSMGTSTSGHAMVGTTKGWYDGKTVTFRYTKNFFCEKPPANKASSNCEGGNLYTQTPAATFDPLYVVVPLFTPGPSARTIQCPAGHCIDHPSTIDLSALMGSFSSATNIPLPAHSHVIATDNMNQPEWWPVVVVGVTSPHAWNEIVEGKNLATVQQLQREGAGVTGNIPTNLFLFFQVLHQGQD